MEKTYGLIYGQCIGDALGARYEFDTSQEATSKVNSDMQGSYLPLLGNGFFKTEPGQITDDSEMALCILNSLVKYKKYKRSKIAKAYIKWFDSKPVDIGKTISRALFTRKKSKGKKDMIEISKELNYSSLSNGTLMRISPLALLYKNYSMKKIEKIVYKECELTHPNPIIKEVSWLYVLTLIQILKNKSKDEVYDSIIRECKDARIYVILRDAKLRPEPTIIWNEKVEFILSDSASCQGYFGVALQNAIYEYLNGHSFDNSMINIIKRGGDTDTNCAIAGALLGAHYGFQKIPKEWIDSIKNYKGSRSNLYSTKNLEELVKNI